jgi:hypothetical protein
MYVEVLIDFWLFIALNPDKISTSGVYFVYLNLLTLQLGKV